MKAVILLLLTVTGFQAETAEARDWVMNPGCVGGPQVMIKSRSGRQRATVNPVSQKTLQCVINGMENSGYPIKWVGGYGCRSLRTSLHPRGLAMDINQSARDITKPRINNRTANAVARSCNAVHGAVWRNPDAGHFEVRSMSRSAQASKRRGR